ncbi:MAG: YibE/F family protein, partial [Treponema sp.]|nr:YibE/F family protein [Treponema sp.]
MILTSLLAFFFTYWFKIHRAARPFAETPLYSGYSRLNLARIFTPCVFLASSGVMMDLSMDRLGYGRDQKAESEHQPPQSYHKRRLRVPPRSLNHVH